jgi:flagellin-like hook-associated protein FlgL
MSLTLGNNLTGLVSRQVDSDGRKASGLGESMTTGNNKFVAVVDKFLGSSLRDNEVILGAVAKNTAYSVNMLSITDEYMSSMATALQGALTASSSAGQVSAEKIPTLQASLNDKITQLKLLIKTASMDNKKLFSGDVKDLGVQVGLNSADKLIVNIKDISDGKVLRSSVTALFNADVTAARQGDYDYYTAPQITTDLAKNNFNLFYAALTGGNGIAGSGTLNTRISDAHIGDILVRVRDALPDAKKTELTNFLNSSLPLTLAAIKVAKAAETFHDVSGANLVIAFGQNNNRGDVARDEFVSLFADSAMTKLSSPASAIKGGDGHIAPNALTAANALTARTALGVTPAILNQAAIERAQDVIQNSLSYIRQEQSSISNQKSNIVETTDALRATTNVTQQAADSYLKADYVLTAQEYSETLRTMVAAITALQAANKIPEAAQRLLDALTR